MTGPGSTEAKAGCSDGLCKNRKTVAHTGAESPAGSLAPVTTTDIKGGGNKEKWYFRVINWEATYRPQKAK